MLCFLFPVYGSRAVATAVHDLSVWDSAVQNAVARRPTRRVRSSPGPAGLPNQVAGCGNCGNEGFIWSPQSRSPRLTRRATRRHLNGVNSCFVCLCWSTGIVCQWSNGAVMCYMCVFLKSSCYKTAMMSVRFFIPFQGGVSRGTSVMLAPGPPPSSAAVPEG